MAYKKAYDFKKVSVNIGISEDAFPLDGLESVSAERNEDENSPYVSGDGSARIVKNNNRTGTITVVVANGAACNDLIMSLYKLDLQFPVILVDKTSTAAVAYGDGCKLMRPPTWARGKEEASTEYKFTCSDLELFHSGAADE
jgi:hypothetical protein